MLFGNMKRRDVTRLHNELRDYNKVKMVLFLVRDDTTE